MDTLCLQSQNNYTEGNKLVEKSTYCMIPFTYNSKNPN